MNEHLDELRDRLKEAKDSIDIIYTYLSDEEQEKFKDNLIKFEVATQVFINNIDNIL